MPSIRSSKSCWLACLLASLGCSNALKPVKFVGYVTLDGEPLAEASVAFEPQGGTGRPASGFTGSDGSFFLTTFKRHDGAVCGNYKVTVSKMRTEGGSPESFLKGSEAWKQYHAKRNQIWTKLTREKAPQEKINAALQKLEDKQKPKYVLVTPEEYAVVDTTPFQVAVPPEGQVRLELVGKK